MRNTREAESPENHEKNEKNERRIMKRRFCELVVGARFEFRGRRYEKMNAEIGHDEERGGNVFHGNTEVIAEVQKAECKMQELADGSRIGDLRFEISKKGMGRMGPVRAMGMANGEWKMAEERKANCGPKLNHGNWWVRPRHTRNRLGRGADREIRAYGTV